MHEEPGEQNEIGEAAAPSGLGGHVENVLSAMVAEPMLRAVVVVLVGHAAAFLAPMLLLGVRDRSLPGMVGVALLFGLTLAGAHTDWRARRLSATTGIVLASWVLGAVFAYAADHYDAW
jgi:hypothetical protein